MIKVLNYSLWPNGYHCIKFWVVALINGIEKARYPYANEWNINRTHILYYTQKLTGNGLRT